MSAEAKVKYYYIAAQQRTESGFYAYCIRVTNLDNISERLRDFYDANVCSSKKEAAALAETWNAQFIANGTHAFMQDCPKTSNDSASIALPF